MFGLRNIHGSCWVNACLQALFRLPDTQRLYQTEQTHPLDRALATIWTSQGTRGLDDLFPLIQRPNLPAGQSIGDSHECMSMLCDQLPWLDTLFRFKTGERIRCQSCGHETLHEDTSIDLHIHPSKANLTLREALSEVVVPRTIDHWTCSHCSRRTSCITQTLLGSFPQAWMFVVSRPIRYASTLVINGHTYALSSVMCYNGAHWWTYGRNMPPGSPWATFDDTHVRPHRGDEFPVSESMRVLLYYRLGE